MGFKLAPRLGLDSVNLWPDMIIKLVVISINTEVHIVQNIQKVVYVSENNDTNELGSKNSVHGFGLPIDIKPLPISETKIKKSPKPKRLKTKKTEKVITLKPKVNEPPRILKLIYKAQEFQTLINTGKAANQADIARQFNITRARVTQIMNLLSLPVEILADIEAMKKSSNINQISEHRLRMLYKIKDPSLQVESFRSMLSR